MSTPLPPFLADALSAEIDPGESLRWSGQPHPGRMVARVFWPTVVLAGFGLVLGIGMAVTGILSGREIIEAHAASGSTPTFGEMAGSRLALFVGCLIAVVCAYSPLGTVRSTRRAALRTVCAVTSTRVLTLTLDRRGRAVVNAVEPGHPLHIIRRDIGEGRGDIHIYPRHQGPPQMLLIGVESAREVERLIRATFDSLG